MFFRRLTIFFALVLASRGHAQCTYSCSSYVLSPISFSMYTGGGDTLSMLDDEVTTTLPLHFNFDFYCNTYNQVRICSNGFITFDFTNINWANTPYAQSLPTSTVPNAVIAWNWNDLDPSQGGTVTYTTVGTSPFKKFIVTYSNVPLWTPANPPSNLRNTGQIVLHETTNLIEIHVAQATNNGWLSHTEGIENDPATIGVTVPGRNLSLWTASLSSHMFSPYETGASPAVAGDTALCEGDSASFVASTLTAAQGYYWSFPPGWISSGNQNSVTAIAGAAGSVSVAAVYTCGNSLPAVIAVSVTPAPVVSVTAAHPATLCSNTIFSVQPGGAHSYTLDPGGLTGSSIFTVQPVTTTTYSLTGTGSSGCLSLKSATTQVIVKPSPSVSVNSGEICLGSTFTMIPSGGTNYSFSSHFAAVSPQQAGLHTYTVTSKASNGCVSAPAISSVTVYPPPSINISANRNNFCANESVTLTASGAATYTWQNVSGSSPTVTIRPFISMVYKVIGVDLNGCSSTASVQILVQPCLVMNEQNSDQIALFPNPSDDRLHLSGNYSGRFVVVDLSGKTVLDGIVRPGEPISVAELAPGVYTLLLRRRESILALRLMKK